MMKTVHKHLCIILLFLIVGCNKKQPQVNIYDTAEYKALTKKDIHLGESIFSVACGQCHRFGTNGAVVLENQKYWDQAATKGIDELFKSVWEGYKGEMV